MIQFTLPDMTCNHCVARVTKAVQDADPAAKVAIDLAAHTLRVEGGAEDRAALAESLREAGYAPAPA